MKAMTKATPITMVALLGGGAVLFGLNAFFPRPNETWFSIAGMIVFVSGLIFGLVAFFRGVATLASFASRQVSGILIPILTVVIAGVAWVLVVATVIHVKRSMDEREKSQQSPGAYSNKAADSLTGNAQE